MAVEGSAPQRSPVPAILRWVTRPAEEGVEGRRARRGIGGSRASPLVINGVMYLTSPYGRVVALDPRTARRSGPTSQRWTPAQRGLE